MWRNDTTRVAALPAERSRRLRAVRDDERPPLVEPRTDPDLVALTAEVERLQALCRRRDRMLERVLAATLALRRGGQALQAENRDLRREVERLRTEG